MPKQDEIIASVSQGQNRDKMLYNALKVIIRLYANKPHFIFELLQNAEDCGASKVLFIKHQGSLEFLHNGRPFTKSNLTAICDISESDKDYTNIGKFGVGFKSVYGICESVLLYSHPQLESEEYPRLHLEIKGFIEPKAIEDEEMPEGYTTRFVFPFVVGKDFSNFKDLEMLRSTIEVTLMNIGAETLLFMKHLQAISYCIEKSDGETVENTFSLKKERIDGKPYTVVTSFASSDDNVSYLVFSKECSIKEGSTVDIAYPFKLDGDKKIFLETIYKNIFVYFPTETASALKFIVQAPFKTTPNRANVPFDDEENIELAKDLVSLYRESILALRDEKELDYDFIRLMPLRLSSFEFFKPISDESWSLLKREPLLLTNKGDEYITPDRAHIVRGEDLIGLFPDEKLTELVGDGKQHRWLPTFITEGNSKYSELYDAFKKASYWPSLNIPVEEADELKPLINSNPRFLPAQSEDWLYAFYNFFNDRKNAFSEREVSKNLRLANIIKTADGSFVSPFVRNENAGRYERNVFLPSKRGITVSGIHIVDQNAFENCKAFFTDVLMLEEPDDFEEFKKEVAKHSAEPDAWTEQQKLDDLIMITLFFDDEKHEEDAKDLAHSLPIIRCFANGELVYEKPQRTYLPKDAEGGDLASYLHGIVDAPIIDLAYYEGNGIPYKTLLHLGTKNSVVQLGPTGGKDYFQGRQRITTWKAIGDFYWKFGIEYLNSVLRQIINDPIAETSKAKSKYIFDVLKRYQVHLEGQINVGTAYPEPRPVKPRIIDELAGEDAYWLFTKNGDLVSPKDLSISDLDTNIYGVPNPDDAIYSIMGMKYDDVDRMLSLYLRLPEDQREEFDRRRYFDQNMTFINQSQEDDIDEEAFPHRPVKNWDLLKTHVQEELISATPVEYQERIRSIRVSKNDTIIRTYLDDMYQTKHACICQSCKKPRIYMEKAQIEGKGDMELEIRSLFLRLCPDCASKFRALRGEPRLAESFKEAIKNLTDEEISSQSPVVVKIGDMEINFTQTHIAEIREVFKELDTQE
ncbi:MAG: hypothetical protein SPL80_01540 [Bacilli bacterium]|nr:hypothetical protein [Bacilli bacterium]